MADIIYTYCDEVYMNITNKCPCNCVFCVRSNNDGLGSAQTLWHDNDPTFEEIKKAVDNFHFDGYSEVVICGYGEPLSAIDNLIKKNEWETLIRLFSLNTLDINHRDCKGRNILYFAI